MRKPINVKDLIQKAPILSKEAAQFFDTERQWRAFLAEHLPEALSTRVVAIGCRPPELTIYVASAAWSARLRYALAELDAAIRAHNPALETIIVRIKPAADTAARGASARSRR